jgi:hypothetical protein
MTQVMEASLNDFVEQIEGSLPKEPTNGLTLNIIAENINLERKFNPSDKINVI